MFLASIRKSSLRRAKICGAIVAYLMIPTHAAADTAAIIGGIDLTGTAPAYAALSSSSGNVTPLALSGSAGISGIISSVSMNSSGISLIGGQGNSGAAYAALISSSGAITPLIITGSTATTGVIYGTAINSNGMGLIGGRDTTGPIYAALVPPSGNPLVPLTFSPTIANGGIINSVAINDSGNGFIGGQGYYDSQPAYAASVSPLGVLTPLTLTGGIATYGTISSVTINPSGNGIIGGQDLSTGTKPYAALVSATGTVTPLTLTGGISTSGEIFSVAINPSGNGIIGGQDQTGGQPAYAALVSPSGSVTPLILTGGVSTIGVINSVAINSSGNGIIGGQDLTSSQPGYAALVSPSGTLTPLSLGTDMDISGIVYSVAINDEGNGLIGGWDQTGTQPGYAALFSSSGIVTPLTLTGGITTNGWINSVALPSLTEIPTSSLSGNNLIFANYINEFASQDAYYFIPSTLNETLNTALQSAAPTRNVLSIYTASNNLFNLTTSFSNHVRNQQSERFLQQKKPVNLTDNGLPCEELLTSLSIQKKPLSNSLLDNPFSIWFETVGALAYQKSQNQTVGFNPISGGAILASDYTVTPQLRLGAGIAYLFTHIHENEGQGHSNINQEEGFIYSSWDNQQFYVDFLVMGGGVQIGQVRNTQMTSFSFRSSSDINGWQLLPHLELGFKKTTMNPFKTNNFCFNPFAMVDWANAWQESFEEKGNSPFNAAQEASYGSLLRTEAGLRFYETFFFQSWNFSLQEKISYVNTQSFNAGKVNAFLVGSPGSFTVETFSSSQNLGLGQVALSFDPLNACYPTTTLFYQGQFSLQYQSHQLNVGLSWQF